MTETEILVTILVIAGLAGIYMVHKAKDIINGEDE